MLCHKGAQVLQSKSINVEEAANELIRMLLNYEDEEEEKAPSGGQQVDDDGDRDEDEGE
jgi:dynein heavy chain